MTPGDCPLTARQIEIVAWLSLGKTAQETAALIDLRPYTVQSHIAHAKERTNSATAAALVATAIRNKWIS